MSSLKDRVEKLKHDLTQKPLRHAIYSDLPFAVFCYPPDEEWQRYRHNRRLVIRTRSDERVFV